MKRNPEAQHSGLLNIRDRVLPFPPQVLNILCCTLASSLYFCLMIATYLVRDYISRKVGAISWEESSKGGRKWEGTHLSGIFKISFLVGAAYAF